MRLEHLWPTLTPAERDHLAAAAGIQPAYLRQLASHWRTSMTTRTLLALVMADERLTPMHLLQEFCEPSPKVARDKRAGVLAKRARAKAGATKRYANASTTVAA